MSHSISHDIDDLHYSQPSRRNGVNTSPLLRAIAAPVATSNSISPFIVAIVAVSRGQTGISTMIPPQVSFSVASNLIPAGKLQDYSKICRCAPLSYFQTKMGCLAFQLKQTPWIQTHPISIEHFYHICPLSQSGCAEARIFLCSYTVVVPFLSP